MATKPPPRTAFKKGEKKQNQGKRGPNKTTVQLKEMILGALDEAGGIDYLVRKANDPRTAAAFLSLIGKVLPMTIQGPGENGEHAITIIERRIVKVK